MKMKTRIEKVIKRIENVQKRNKNIEQRLNNSLNRTKKLKLVPRVEEFEYSLTAIENSASVFESNLTILEDKLNRNGV